MERFWGLIELNCIKKDCYDYLFTKCNKAEYLFSNYSNVTYTMVETLKTFCPQIFPFVVSQKQGKSWGMQGEILTFELSCQVKNFILNLGLNNIFKLENNCLLENLTLYKDNKTLYSVCSHEGYDHIDETLLLDVTNFALEKLKTTKIYTDLLVKFKSLNCKDFSLLASYQTILYDLANYVAKDWNSIIYQTPNFNDINYKDFVKVANKILLDDILKVFNSCTSFKQLHPSGYATTLKEANNFIGKPNFYNSEIYKLLQEQLLVFNAIYYLEKGETLTTSLPPSITINNI